MAEGVKRTVALRATVRTVQTVQVVQTVQAVDEVSPRPKRYRFEVFRPPACAGENREPAPDLIRGGVERLERFELLERERDLRQSDRLAVVRDYPREAAENVVS